MSHKCQFKTQEVIPLYFKKNNTGFTLIELFIVVAILAILAAIAIPGYLGMQERSKKGAVVRAAGASLAEAEIKKLADGYISFNPSSEMTVGDTERISVFICTKDFEKELKALKLKGTSDPKIEKIKVGTIMKSRLMGDNFKIESLSHEEQIVAGITLWEYSVTPLKSGIHTLLLSVTVKINIPGIGEKPKDYPVFERKIKDILDILRGRS